MYRSGGRVTENKDSRRCEEEDAIEHYVGDMMDSARSKVGIAKPICWSHSQAFAYH
jgi:hypothetical protein